MAKKQQHKQSLWLFGVHACLKALENPLRQVHKGFVLKNVFERHAPFFEKFSQLQQVDKVFFQDRFPEVVHQGVALEVSPLPEKNLDDLALGEQAQALVVVLDQVTDPHNIGAILRASAVFGAQAIITTDRYAPQDEGTIAKVASGALEVVPLLKEVNLARALQDLKKEGFWIYGLDESGEKLGRGLAFTEKVAIVMGAEGKGLRRLTKENCDYLVALPTADNFTTLNVATATAVTLYEISQQLKEEGHV